MTPPTAQTEAARKAAAKINDASAPGGVHARPLRPSGAPAVPRRVSGPLNGGATAAPRSGGGATTGRSGGGATAGRSGGGATAAPRSETAPRTRLRPRAAVGAIAAPRWRVNPEPLWSRLAAFLRSLPDRALIDRLVRGRAWIPVLGVMLVGIVAMQVEVLKLGAGIGRAVQQTTELSARNEALRASVAALGDDQRIESVAAGMGMIMPAPGAVGFLNASGTGSARAAANIRPPNAAQFLNAPSTNGAVAIPPTVTAPGGASATAAGGGTTSAAGATSPLGTGALGTGTPGAMAGTPTATSTGTSAGSGLASSGPPGAGAAAATASPSGGATPYGSQTTGSGGG